MKSALRTVVQHPLILPFYLPSILLAICNGMLAPVLPLYAKDLKISYSLVGLVLAGEGLGMLVGDVPAGMLLRRFGQKGTMLLGVGGTALSTFGLFWARSTPEVIACRLVAGFCGALYYIARHAYIANAVTTSVRGRAISLLGGLFRVGRFIGPVLGGTIAATFGLRATFLVYGGLGAVVVSTIAFFVQGSRTDPRPAVRHPSGGHFLVTLKTHYRTLATAGAAQLFAQMIRAGRMVIIPLYAADVIGLDVQAIGFIVSMASAVDMLFFYPAGWIMDHLGRKFAIVPSFALQALGMFLVSFTGSFPGLLLVAMLIGFANGFSSGSMMTLGADLAPKTARGEFLGVWRFIGDAGSSGAPLVVGGIADWLVLPTAAWVISLSGIAAAAIFGFLVPETLVKPHRAVTPASGDD
ncbi:MAG: MFS transporter [Anaerolineae bacterium]|nr:MFS transporter [Anaerolineae bacterium]